MRRGVVLPGSTLGEEESVAAAGGRLSAEDVVTLAQVAAWWRFRLAHGDAADPVASLIGGVDGKGTATTTGPTGGEVALAPPFVVPANGGFSLLVHACGRGTGVGGAIYSLLGLAHFYDTPSGVSSSATAIARLPSSATTLDLHAAVTPVTNAITLSIAGPAGETVEWVVDLYRLG